MSVGLAPTPVEALEGLTQDVPRCECVDEPAARQCSRPANWVAVCNGCNAQMGLLCNFHKKMWDVAQHQIVVGCTFCRREGHVYYVVRVVAL